MGFQDLIHIGVFFQLLLQDKPASPIIVKITEPAKSELSALSDVLLGSLGLSGALTLLAILFGVALGGLMFWLRKRDDSGHLRL